jgi:TRAP-type C4-dicarboxylate transport system substrate-binding protein
VNTPALEDLSDAHREALLGSVDEALEYYVTQYESKTMEAWGPALDERGIERVTFSDEEIAAFKEAAAAPAAAAWIEENTARRLPAQELYDLVTGMVANGS